MRALTRRAAFDRPSTRASRRCTGAVSPDDREAIGALDKWASIGQRPSPETTGLGRESPSLRRRRYATEWPMSAIFAANATISAQQNNGPNSMHAIRRKCRCLGLLLPACFPSFEATSRLILFSFKMTYTARHSWYGEAQLGTSKLPLTE